MYSVWREGGGSCSTKNSLLIKNGPFVVILLLVPFGLLQSFVKSLNNDDISKYLCERNLIKNTPTEVRDKYHGETSLQFIRISPPHILWCLVKYGDIMRSSQKSWDLMIPRENLKENIIFIHRLKPLSTLLENNIQLYERHLSRTPERILSSRPDALGHLHWNTSVLSKRNISVIYRNNMYKPDQKLTEKTSFNA